MNMYCTMKLINIVYINDNFYNKSYKKEIMCTGIKINLLKMILK